MILVLSSFRLCTLNSPSTNNPNDPSRILRIFVIFIMLASLLRLICWLLCTKQFYSNDQHFLKYATYQRIKRLTLISKANNETNWLPIEPDHFNGLDCAPKMLVTAIYAPDVLIIIAYLALSWLCFSSFIDSHSSQSLTGQQDHISGRMIFCCLTTLMLILQTLLFSLYLADAIDATTILVQLQTIEMMFPIVVLLFIVYYQCKFTGRPQFKYAKPRAKALTRIVVVFSILRLFQYWSGLFASRQLLGMTLLLQGLSYESYLFIPLMIIIQFLFIEVIPFLYVLDQEWLDKMGNKELSAAL